MKNLIFVFFCFLSVSAFAQKNSLKFAPLQLVAGKIDLTYERKVGTKTSLLFNYQRIERTRSSTAQGLVYPVLTAIGGRTVTKSSGTAIDLSLRRYLSAAERMNGFYVQGGLRFGNQTDRTRQEGGLFSIWEPKEEPVTTNKSLGGLHLRAGWQWVTPGGFTLDAGLGGGKYLEQEKGFMLLNCKLGYAF